MIVQFNELSPFLLNESHLLYIEGFHHPFRWPSVEPRSSCGCTQQNIISSDIPIVAFFTL